MRVAAERGLPRRHAREPRRTPWWRLPLELAALVRVTWAARDPAGGASSAHLLELCEQMLGADLTDFASRSAMRAETNSWISCSTQARDLSDKGTARGARPRDISRYQADRDIP